jgi:PAP2 superfamily
MTIEPNANTGTRPANDSTAGLGQRLLRILIATAFGLLILLAWVGLPFDIPYIGYGLASAFVFQIAVRPRRWEILAVVVGGAALTAFDQFVVHQGTKYSFQISTFLGFLGLVSFLLVGFRAVWAEGDEREQLKSILVPAAALTFFVFGSQSLLNLAGLLFPKTTDLYAYAFDGSLGFQPSFLVGRLFRDSAFIGAIGRFTYYSLPLAMAVVYAAHLRRKKTPPLFIIEVFMAAGLLGYGLYLLFPAAGPRYVAGPEFPGAPLSLADLHQLVLRTVPLSWIIPRNAMPSLHMTWALLIWLNCKPFSRFARALAFALVLTTVLDTLGTGEHYLVDLVVALPFAVAVQALCIHSVPVRSRARFAPLFGGATLTLLWPMLVRYGTTIFLWSPMVPWTCIIISTALAVLWIRRIQLVGEGEPQKTVARTAAAGA